MSTLREETIEQLKTELREAEQAYDVDRRNLSEGDGSFSRLLEAREALQTFIDLTA